MNTAVITSTNDIAVNYSGNVNETDFTNSDFTTTPGAFSPDTIDQGFPDQLILTFLEDITSETLLTYNGSVAGIQTPQAIAII